MAIIHDQDVLDTAEARTLECIEQTVYRVTFDSQPVLRANARGARWNPQGVDAIYTSMDRDAAVAEFEHLLRVQALPATKPWSVHEVSVSVTGVVDFSDPDVLAEFGIDEGVRTSIREEDVRRCQAIGDAVFWLECGGLLVPSARANAVNLVIFESRVGPDDHVEVIA